MNRSRGNNTSKSRENKPASPPISVYIVDDHPLVREGLASFIETQPDIRVCGTGEKIATVLSDLKKLKVDVMIVDLSLGGESGLDLLSQLHSRYPTVLPLVLTMHRSGQLLQQALKLGARGFILKEDTTDAIVTGIRAIKAGGLFISQHLRGDRILAGDALSTAPAPHAESLLVECLSKREREVLQLLGEGRKNTDIAQSLGMSVKTVHAHRENIKRKLQLKDFSQLIGFAARWATPVR